MRKVAAWIGQRVDRRGAVAVALSLIVLTGVIDRYCSAESACALLYLAPIAIVAWRRGRIPGIVIAFICSCVSLITDRTIGVNHSVVAAALNLVGESALFVVYCEVIIYLRNRVQKEMSLRLSALDELRHAQRLGTLGELAAGLAHELGTPLNVIGFHADLVGSVTPPDLGASARVIREQTQRMGAIVRGMLAFARRSSQERQQHDILSLVDEAVRLYIPLVRDRGVTVEVTGDALIAKVNGAEIQQVVTNLLSNAVHATPRGGNVVLATTRARMRLRETGSTEAKPYVCIAVTDNGRGIPADVLPRIFDPFFTTKEVGDGTGLGLSVAYGIVRDHGGAIRLRSSVNRGTSFRVYLPE